MLTNVTNLNKTKVKSVKLEKTFDFEIRLSEIGLSGTFWMGDGVEFNA